MTHYRSYGSTTASRASFYGNTFGRATQGMDPLPVTRTAESQLVLTDDADSNTVKAILHYHAHDEQSPRLAPRVVKLNMEDGDLVDSMLADAGACWTSGGPLSHHLACSHARGLCALLLGHRNDGFKADNTTSYTRLILENLSGLYRDEMVMWLNEKLIHHYDRGVSWDQKLVSLGLKKTKVSWNYCGLELFVGWKYLWVGIICFTNSLGQAVKFDVVSCVAARQAVLDVVHDEAKLEAWLVKHAGGASSTHRLGGIHLVLVSQGMDPVQHFVRLRNWLSNSSSNSVGSPANEGRFSGLTWGVKPTPSSVAVHVGLSQEQLVEYNVSLSTNGGLGHCGEWPSEAVTALMAFVKRSPTIVRRLKCSGFWVLSFVKAVRMLGVSQCQIQKKITQMMESLKRKSLVPPQLAVAHASPNRTRKQVNDDKRAKRAKRCCEGESLLLCGFELFVWYYLLVEKWCVGII